MNHLKAIALNKFAKQAWGFNERYKTISLLTEALRRDPANPEIILNLAMACGKQRDYERAEELLSRLLELAPRKASIFRRVAQTYAMIDRPEQAVTCYRKSLELNRDISATVPTLLDLAAAVRASSSAGRSSRCRRQKQSRASLATRRPSCSRPFSIADGMIRLARRPACAHWSPMNRVFGPFALRRDTSSLNYSTTPSGTTSRFKSC